MTLLSDLLAVRGPPNNGIMTPFSFPECSEEEAARSSVLRGWAAAGCVTPSASHTWILVLHLEPPLPCWLLPPPTCRLLPSCLHLRQAIGHGKLQVLIVLREVTVGGPGSRGLPHVQVPGPGGDRRLLLAPAQLQTQGQVIGDTCKNSWAP